jgi:hypothetical protein
MIFLSILTSIVGLVGFFINKTAFLVGGIISFIFMAIYLVNIAIVREREEEIEIMKNGSYQRTKNSVIFKANNVEELRMIIAQVRMTNIVSKSFIYVVVCLIIFLLFKWNGFVWLGIAFGLAYILELIKKVFSRR